jgi:phosphate:Na+ symporter
MLIVEVIGGIGLFLLGMTLMTDGLQEAAAERLRELLRRVTGSRIRGVIAGAGVTALVQSSTATTLATIGFVSAGLITFQQSVAVIVGSNIGTTSTGWIVALLGFKVPVAAFALPLIAVGAAMRMSGRERLRPIGLALAGFGVIFVGLDILQSGMAEVATRFDLSGLGGESIGSRLVLVGIGFAMTVVMQSSSAAIAATLAAVYSEAIGVPAALALLVGQNVGTTATAVMASMGATVPAKQTALAHVLFKVITAAIVFFLLPLVPPVAAAIRLDGDPTILLAAFHTAFSLFGALLILPVRGSVLPPGDATDP